MFRNGRLILLLKRYHLLFRDAAMLRKRLQEERKNLRARIDKRTIRVSKCAETYIEFFNLHHEYDSFLVAAEPSNPWVSDSTEFWEMFGGGGGGGLHGIFGRVPKEQIAEALVAHGIDPSDDDAANIDALAVVLV